MSCGAVGTSGADGVIIQLGGRGVRVCEECGTECVFSPFFFLISARLREIDDQWLLRDPSKFDPRKDKNEKQVRWWGTDVQAKYNVAMRS